jgi:hypothetical protein
MNVHLRFDRNQRSFIASIETSPELIFLENLEMRNMNTQGQYLHKRPSCTLAELNDIARNI